MLTYCDVDATEAELERLASETNVWNSDNRSCCSWKSLANWEQTSDLVGDCKCKKKKLKKNIIAFISMNATAVFLEAAF